MRKPCLQRSTMRTTLLRLAESATKRPLSPREAAAALLPPIPCVVLTHRTHMPPTFCFHRLGFTVRYCVRTETCRRKCGPWVTSMSSLVSFHFHIKCYVDNDCPEFRLHKDVTNPAHIIGFLSQWKTYLDHMPNREGGEFYRGKKLDPTVFEKVGTSRNRAK